MPTLHVRNVPDDLYQQLHEEAAADNRSLSAQVIMMLQSVIHGLRRRREQQEILDQLRLHRIKPSQEMPDTTALLREDRER